MLAGAGEEKLLGSELRDPFAHQKSCGLSAFVRRRP
jgi:hypothetical protein